MRMNFEEKEMRRLEALKEIAELLNEIKNIHPVCKFITCNNVCNTFSNISCKFVASFNNSAICYNCSW
jgi:lysyl-tRNA synthetase class I